MRGGSGLTSSSVAGAEHIHLLSACLAEELQDPWSLSLLSSASSAESAPDPGFPTPRSSRASSSRLVGAEVEGAADGTADREGTADGTADAATEGTADAATEGTADGTANAATEGLRLREGAANGTADAA